MNLTAEPGSGYQLMGWEGACEGTGDCQVTMSKDVNVTAVFGRRVNSSVNSLLLDQKD